MARSKQHKLAVRVAALPDSDPVRKQVKDGLTNCLTVKGTSDPLLLARRCAELIARALHGHLAGSEPTLLDECIQGLRDPAINSGTVPGTVVNALDNCKLFGNPAAHGRVVQVELDPHLTNLVAAAEWFGTFRPPTSTPPSPAPPFDVRKIPLAAPLLTTDPARGDLATALGKCLGGKGTCRLAQLLLNRRPTEAPAALRSAVHVLNGLGGVLPRTTLDGLNPLERFCLVFVTLVHCLPALTPECEGILGELHRGSGLSSADGQRLARAILAILEAQRASRDDLRGLLSPARDATFDRDTVRPRLLAMLLRIGDLLAVDADRSDPPSLAAHPGWTGGFRRQGGRVTELVASAGQLRVRVECDDKGSHQAWARWLDHLRAEIEFATLYVFRQDLDGFQLPAPDFQVERAPGATYTLWPLRFEIDQDGHLWEVLRRSVYTGRYDYVREIVSNAIDACVRHMFDQEGTNITVANANSPREWELAGYQPLVLVLLDRAGNRLAICDNGVGMDRDDLQNFLFKVAGRGTARRQRDVDLPTIGQFGVGFISILTRADSVRLATRRRDHPGCAVDITSGLREASVEELPGQPEAGTSICLRLKETEPPSRDVRTGARGYLEETFVYPSVRIELIDCDALRKAHAEVSTWTTMSSPPIDEWFAAVEGRSRPLRDITTQAHRTARRLLAPIEEENSTRGIANEETRKRNEQDRADYTTRLSEYHKAIRAGLRVDSAPIRPDPHPLLPLVDRELVRTSTNVIEPHGPTLLPLDTALLVRLRRDGRVRSVRRVTATRQCPPPDGLSILVAPVSFDDHARGVEWRSIHTFILGEGVLKDEVVFDPKVNEKSLARYFPQGIPLRRHEHTDAENARSMLYDMIEEELAEQEVSVAQLLRATDENRRQLHAPELYYKSFVTTSNRVVFQDVDCDGEVQESSELFRHLATEGGTTNAQGMFLSIAEWYKSTDVVCQDGIRIALSLSSIAPVGAACGEVNLTASSRLALNISRNALDRGPDRLRQWRKNVGMPVLRQVRRRLIDYFGWCGMKVSAGALWTGAATDDHLMTYEDWKATGE